MSKEEFSRQLVDAAGTGDRLMVQALLEQGADANTRLKDGLTPLMAAATSGHTEIVRKLLDAGADPDLRDDHGMTGLDDGCK